MAKKKTTVRNISKRYVPKFERAKEDFKNRTGKLIARGFKDSPEYKRIERNERRAISRHERKVFTAAADEIDNLDRVDELPAIEETDSVKNIEAIDQESSFYNVLSYGGKTDKLAAQMFDLNKQNNDFSAILDFRKDGLGMSVHKDRASFDFKMKWIYSRLLNKQKTQKMGSMGSTVSTTIGDYNGNTTLIIQSD